MEMRQMKKAGAKLLALLLMFSGTLLSMNRGIENGGRGLFRDQRTFLNLIFNLEINNREVGGCFLFLKPHATKDFIDGVRGYLKEYEGIDISDSDLYIDGKRVPEGKENFWDLFPSFTACSNLKAVKKVKQEVVRDNSLVKIIMNCYLQVNDRGSTAIDEKIRLTFNKGFTNKDFLDLLRKYLKEKISFNVSLLDEITVNGKRVRETDEDFQNSFGAFYGIATLLATRKIKAPEQFNRDRNKACVKFDLLLDDSDSVHEVSLSLDKGFTDKEFISALSGYLEQRLGLKSAEYTSVFVAGCPVGENYGNGCAKIFGSSSSVTVQAFKKRYDNRCMRDVVRFTLKFADESWDDSPVRLVLQSNFSQRALIQGLQKYVKASEKYVKEGKKIDILDYELKISGTRIDFTDYEFRRGFPDLGKDPVVTAKKWPRLY
jgi:translation initiation factor 2 beta subunit (eIF-2beta)/eIF-5